MTLIRNHRSDRTPPTGSSSFGSRCAAAGLPVSGQTRARGLRRERSSNNFFSPSTAGPSGLERRLSHLYAAAGKLSTISRKTGNITCCRPDDRYAPITDHLRFHRLSHTPLGSAGERVLPSLSRFRKSDCRLIHRSMREIYPCHNSNQGAGT
jgi:hypothetical protein